MPDEKDRDDAHQTDEAIEQQDLNQGMDTGTHDSTRHGVNWPASYRRKVRKPEDEPAKRKVG
jgi:hypothetical protein